MSAVVESRTSFQDEGKLDTLLALTVQLVSSHAGRTSVDSDALPALIEKVFHSLSALKMPIGTTVARLASVPAGNDDEIPAVPIAQSITPDFLVCLEDGRKVKLLHRYLRTRFRMSPNEYRRKWKLPADYPMVAPAYSESRREHAKKVGFQKIEQVAEVVAVAKPAKTRRAKAEAVAEIPAAKRVRRKLGIATG